MSMIRILLGVLLLAVVVSAVDAPVLSDQETAYRIRTQNDLLLAQRENAVMRLALIDRRLEDLNRERLTFEQTHPAPEGYVLDWGLTPPAYRAVTPDTKEQP